MLDAPLRSLKLLIRGTNNRLDIKWYIVLTYPERRTPQNFDYLKSDLIEIRKIDFFRKFFRKMSLIHQKIGKNLRNTMQLVPSKNFNPNPTFFAFFVVGPGGVYPPRHFLGTEGPRGGGR